jgi:hypothetical protein
VRVLKLLVLVGALFYNQPVIGEVVSDERASVVDTSAQAPISKENNDTKFWFEDIEGDHTVYWQFIEVYEKVKGSLEKVARRLTKYISDNRVDAGDSLLNQLVTHPVHRDEVFRV